ALERNEEGIGMNRDEWLHNRVMYLKSLKSRSEPQQLLVLLAEKLDRSAGDNQLLAALIRLEQANDRAAEARVAAAKLIQASKRQSAKADRKARTHRLIQQGVLFDLAGLAHRSRGELLGLLLAAAKTEDPQRWAAWKQAGDALLAENGDAEA
ncbi:MAG: conjugal transfer protein TraD, partial [Accumulibacter sp.]|uniref:conjugal transfer protein TraD n=1 Tax=Accumulibacter sp. TaxID=2053492 RepID=UPI0033157ECD